jgi:hypothetical protein
MLLLNKIKTDLNLTRNEFIYGLVTTTRRLERLAAQVEVTYKFCAAPKEAARVAVINPPSVRNMKKMWVVKDTVRLVFFRSNPKFTAQQRHLSCHFAFLNKLFR